MNSQTAALGVRFEIDKLEQEGGPYGKVAWTTFWRAVEPATLPKGTILYEGDTARTLNGSEHVYCLTVQSSDSIFLNRVRTALHQSEEYQRFAASPQFVTDRSLYAEPFPQAGHVDGKGDIVVHQYSYLRPALGQVAREKRSTDHSSAAAIPDRSRPASPRSANLPPVPSLSELRTLLMAQFVPPKQSPYHCYVTPEELCDIVEQYREVIQAYCVADPHHFSGDGFSVVLHDRKEVEGSKPYRLTGMFPFASAADAISFCGFEGGIDPSAWGIDGKHAMNFQGSDSGLIPGKDELKESELDANGLWERVCRRRHELGATKPKKPPKISRTMITFACPRCGKDFQVKAEFAGRKTKCPKCGQALLVPTPPPPTQVSDPSLKPPARTAARSPTDVSKHPVPVSLESAAASRSSDLSCLDIAQNVLELVPASVARENSVIPIEKAGNKLRIAMADTSEGETIDILRFILNCDIDPVVARREEIEQAIDRWYGPADRKPLLPALSGAFAGPYFESSRPSGDATCSDDSCPCPGVALPRGTGYLFISEEVIEFRKDAIAEGAAAAKIQDLQRKLGAIVANPNLLASPILMCKMGAEKRGIDLAWASRDAQYWWRTGKVPMRPTPTVGQGASAYATGEGVSQKQRPAPHVRINQEHYEKMKRVLVNTSKEISKLRNYLPPGARNGTSGPLGPHQSEFLAVSLPLACRFFYDQEFPKEEGFGSSVILDFSNTDISDEVFASMMFDRQFDHVKFMHANLDNTFWSIANMKDADFTGASLRECTISNMDCSGCCFKHVNLSGARIHGLRIDEGRPVDFTGANFAGARIELIDPVHMILTDAVMTECRVSTGLKTQRRQKKKSLRAFLQCLSEAQRTQIFLDESDKQLVESAGLTFPEKPWWNFW